MKLISMVSGLVFCALTGFAFNAHATNVPVSCSWETTSTTSTPTGPYVYSACKNGSSIIASRAQKFGQNPSCSLSTNSPYQYTGTCDSPSFYYVEAAQCTRSGAYWGSVTVGNGQPPIPYDAINAFCGSCGYNMVYRGSGANSAGFDVYCK